MDVKFSTVYHIEPVLFDTCLKIFPALSVFILRNEYQYLER